MKQLVIVAHSSFVIETIRLTLRREPWLVSTAFALAGRVWLISSERRVGRKGEAGQRALIVGAWQRRSLGAKRLLEHPEVGIDTDWVPDKEPPHTGEATGVPLGASSDLDRLSVTSKSTTSS
jgi:hypothetical protein